ncbi:MAG: exodeoxyribonuclease VII large subunit, partial [Bacteriovoracaceae bacterium]
MSLKTLTVADLVFGIKSNLESQFRQVLVEGEVSNISRTVAGHVYFTLSDERACVSCALFRADALRNAIIRKIKAGDRILVVGSLGVYAKRGVFQIVAKRLSPAGKGNLAFQFELLKEKFSKLGYFDAQIKQTVPKFPKRIALITAPYGAALQDFLKVMKRRSLWHDIVIVPAVVQGEESPASVVEALKNAQALKDVDVIVLTRGGGAMEDLWSFNHESVVEQIHQCEIPVISAIGHEVDTTLADFVADLRL